MWKYTGHHRDYLVMWRNFNMSQKRVIYSGGMSLGSTLFVVFLVLKLTGAITWSWWWVFSPIWIPWSIIIGLAILFLFGYGIYRLFGGT